MDDVRTSIRVNGGPEVQIDLKEGIDAPGNADAKEQMSEMFASRARAPAHENNLAADRLRLFIERVERLEEERKGLADDIADVLKEAKSDGYDKATLKRIIKLRKMEPHKLREAEALLSTYMDALGMTPIEAAIALAA
jgi:uncharacterized protein (UPF0335 family)